jgi:hypothetical protein
MPELSVERLALKLSGLSEWEGRRLARMIAEGLGAASLPEGLSRDVGALRLQVEAQPGDALERLAQQIVAEVLRQL